MAHLLRDLFDWYHDLMDNRSGEINQLFLSIEINLIKIIYFRYACKRLANDAVTFTNINIMHELCIFL